MQFRIALTFLKGRKNNANPPLEELLPSIEDDQILTENAHIVTIEC